jgi:hypothetical protein
VARGRTIHSVRSGSSSGPFTTTCVAASNLSVGSGVVVIFFCRAHLTASARFRVRVPGPVSGRLSTPRQLEGWHPGRSFPLPFGHRHSLFGHPVPAEELGPPCGRLTGPESGPRRGYHVPHARAAIGLGALCAPRTTVLTPDGATSRPAPAASQRLVPAPRQPSHRRGCLNEASTKGSHVFARPIFPRLWSPGWNGLPLGFPWASHPADQEPDDARQGRDRPSSTDLELHAQLIFCRSPIR